MREELLLTERNYSGPLYHATGSYKIEDIIKSNDFILSQFGVDNIPYHKMIENKPRGYDYFLSTSRSKLNQFRRMLDATFVLDSSWFNKGDYIIKPFDYFGLRGKTDSRRVESEERIWSRKERVSLDCVKELHLNIGDYVNTMLSFKYDTLDSAKEVNQVKAALMSNIESRSREYSIISQRFDTYFYHNKEDYLLLRKNKAAHNDADIILNYIIDRIEEQISAAAVKESVVLNEKHYSGVAYHTTNHANAVNIIHDGSFMLYHITKDLDNETLDLNSQYRKLLKKGFKYYFSMGRSKVNRFTIQANYKVVFVIDLSFFNNKTNDYILLPLNYFYKKGMKGTWRESEERVWSKEDNLSIDCVKEIHVVEPDQLDHDRDYDKHIEDMAIEISPADFDSDEAYRDHIDSLFQTTEAADVKFIAKEKNIPCYYYGHDYKNFKLLNKKKAKVV